MKQNSSSRRVNEQARQVIAEILMFDISDPRLSGITITGCEVSFDRTSCNVYYTTDPDNYEEAAAALKRAAGKIRSEMAKKLSWRVAPELRFHLDKSVDQAESIARALANEAQRVPQVAESDDDVDGAGDESIDTDGASGASGASFASENGVTVHDEDE